MNKQWQVKRGVSEELKGLFPELDPVILQLLVNREIIDLNVREVTKESQTRIDEFLKPDWATQIHDPFLLRDMARAVERIFKSIERGEKITIFGDYDADGICGSVILYQTLIKLGAKTPEIYIPHKAQEGYGLNESAVRQLIAGGTKLLITVDLGISNVAEVALAQEQGADVIIVDHHDLVDRGQGKEVPKAYAVIHADVPGESYPFKDLSGTGTAFKLAQGLLKHSLEEVEAFEKWLLDLVATGTIADMVPLRGENRVFTKYGLVVLNKTQNLGLKLLIKTAGLNKIDSWSVAWQLAPRINAAGRISHAREALVLFLADDEEQAKELADHLNDINSERQDLTSKIYSEAKAQFGDTEDEDYMLIGYSPTWSLGVVGLVAGKLVREFNKPVILLTDERGIVTGSGRSIPGFDITQSLSEFRDFLISFGGHVGACGLSLEKSDLEKFTQGVKQVAQRELKGLDLRPTLEIDMELEFGLVDEDLVEKIGKFEPFGMGNPQPLFLSKKLIIKSLDTVGGNGQHLKLLVCDEREQNMRKAIGFGLANGWQEEIKVGERIDIVYDLSFNEWNGNREVQVKLKDLRKSFT